MPKKTEITEPVVETAAPRSNPALKVVIAATAVFLSLILAGVVFAGGLFIGRATAGPGRGAMMRQAYCERNIERRQDKNFERRQNRNRESGMPRGGARQRDRSPQNIAPLR